MPDSRVTESDRKKIIDHYQKAQGSIQDIARVYRYTVQEVLEVLDLADSSSITMQGDLIDQEEAGEDAKMNYGRKRRQTFTTD